MSAILDELAVTLLEQLIGQTNQLGTALQLQAIQNLCNSIFDQDSAILTLVENINATQISGQLTIEQQLNFVLDEIHTLMAQVGQPQQTGIAVRLPTVAPPGYGGASSSAIADAVWAEPMPNAVPFTALEAQDSLMGLMFMLSNNNTVVPIEGNPGYAIGGAFSEPAATFSGPNQAFLDFSTILPTDASLFAWATRVYPTSPWQHGPNGTVFENDSLNHAINWWVDLTQDQFRAHQAGAAAAARVAPVWPGIANVTLGTTIALSDGLVVPGPLDGVIVNITAVSPPVGFYAFGTVRSYARAGAIVFRDDNSNYEFPSPFGPQSQVVCAREIQHPTSAIIRLKSGITGTVTPWVTI